jgi:transposase-like protein
MLTCPPQCGAGFGQPCVSLLIRDTNPLEPVNRETKRRTDVVGIFPKEAAVLRRTGAVLLEVHDEWAIAERPYLAEGSTARLDATADDGSTREVGREADGA